MKVVCANICSLGRLILSSLFSQPQTWHLLGVAPGLSIASQINKVNSPSQPLELPSLSILTSLDDNTMFLVVGAGISEITFVPLFPYTLRIQHYHQILVASKLTQDPSTS